MRRSLWIGLALVGAMVVYVSGEQSDELLATDRSAKHGVDARSVPATATAAAASTPPDPALEAALVTQVRAWQSRSAQLMAIAPPPKRMAWASMQPAARRMKALPNEAPPPPPAPMAPRFPHAWVGRFNDDAPLGLARAVVAGQQGTWVVHAGDVIEGEWHIDNISDRQMMVTYLPLKQQQTVAMK